MLLLLLLNELFLSHVLFNPTGQVPGTIGWTVHHNIGHGFFGSMNAAPM